MNTQLSSETLPTSSVPTTTMSSIEQESTSFFSSPIFITILVILFLAVVGFNVFTYLSAGTESAAGAVKPAASGITGYIKALFDSVISTAQQGGKGGLDVVGDTIKSITSLPDDLVKGTIMTSDAKKGSQQKKDNILEDAEDVDPEEPEKKKPSKKQNDLQKKLDKPKIKHEDIVKKDMSAKIKDRRMIPPLKIDGDEPHPLSDMKESVLTPENLDESLHSHPHGHPHTAHDEPEPVPVDTTDKTQGANVGKKTGAGYCYIGEDRGFRSCIEIDEFTKCMSGEIFESAKKCRYPNARYDV
tara:strand:- start:671 stop:1570 length:900 start_codon:yes stop_codon:yes gene_type:complete